MRPQLACRACQYVPKPVKRLYSSARLTRDYDGAVQALNSLQSNFAAVEAVRKLGPGRNSMSIPQMIENVRQLGYEVCLSSAENV